MTEHLVQGEKVTMPVQIRQATACSAMFPVPAKAVRSLLGDSTVDIVEPLPGKGICSLAFVQYLDGDLGPYHEFAVAFLIRSASGIGAFIHWLPVNQSFTLEAGRSIWGFPKELADIELRANHCTVRKDGKLVVDLLIKPGVPVPGGGAGGSVDAYTAMDGTLRRTPWQMRPRRVRARPGGAVLRLGDHPIADELRELGLPRRAWFSSTIGALAMTFAGAEVVR